MLGIYHCRLLPLLTTLALLYISSTLLLRRLVRLRLNPSLALRLELLLVVPLERDTLDEDERKNSVESDEANKDEEKGAEPSDVGCDDLSFLLGREVEES